MKQFKSTVKCVSVQIEKSLKFSASLTFGSVVSVAGFVAAMSEPSWMPQCPFCRPVALEGKLQTSCNNRRPEEFGVWSPSPAGNEQLYPYPSKVQQPPLCKLTSAGRISVVVGDDSFFNVYFGCLILTSGKYRCRNDCCLETTASFQEWKTWQQSNFVKDEMNRQILQ